VRLDVVFSFVLLLSYAVSQPLAEDVVNLWEGQPPLSKENSLEENVQQAWGVPCVYNVTVPAMTVHRARETSSGQAVVVLPGGGYELESFEAEGRVIAEALAEQGITAAVVKYRLPLKEASDQPWLLPLTDARRGIALLRSLAVDYGFDPGKVGVLGFSAGGHLAATVSVLQSEEPSEIPDFSALVYAVTTLAPENRKWLEENLFHRPMTDEEVARYALVDHVVSTTPPAFLVHAYDDDVVPISESEVYARALIAAGGEVEVHYFPRGGHGFGPGRMDDGTAQWLSLVANWIKRQ